MKIFISYRRAGDNKSYIVGTIYDKLAEVFGRENVFRETERILLENTLNSKLIILNTKRYFNGKHA